MDWTSRRLLAPSIALVSGIGYRAASVGPTQLAQLNDVLLYIVRQTISKLGISCEYLGIYWAMIGICWAILGYSFDAILARFETIFGHLGAIALGPPELLQPAIRWSN
jgi:hypothetical protein